MSTKVLVSGDVCGNVQCLFARVGALHATKGPFDCLFCVGDFFGALGADDILAAYRLDVLSVCVCGECELGTKGSDIVSKRSPYGSRGDLAVVSVLCFEIIWKPNGHPNGSRGNSAFVRVVCVAKEGGKYLLKCHIL